MNAKNKIKRKHDNRKSDLQSQIIQRKNDEIESFKNRILSLEIDCKEKDELINSVDHLRVELQEIVEDLKKKGEEYDALIEDLRMMKVVFNQEVFRGRWRIIKWLMK